MRITVTILFLLFAGRLTGQNTIGLPEIINYPKQAYKAGTQNWDIRQDRNGVLYFANNEGLLSFDGFYWKTYPLPGKTNVRSLAFGPDNRIYIGSQGEIGYFSPAANGRLVYHSLLPLLPQRDQAFADVWDVVVYEKQVFFRSSTKIIQYNGQTMAVYNNRDWRFLGTCNRQLVAQDAGNNLLLFQNGVWAPFIREHQLPPGFLVTGLVSLNRDSALVTTLKNGVYVLADNRLTPLQSPALQAIALKNIYTAAVINPEHILLATSLDGCFIIDKKGQLVQRLSVKEGLQNNNILSVFLDQHRNIWLGLDNGIDFMAYNNAIKHIYPDIQNEGAGYASIVHNDQLYIGTSNGLYTLPVSNTKDLSLIKGSFTPVAGTKGQVWNLSSVNGTLLMGHHEGSFIINREGARNLDPSTGFWTFMPLDNVLPSATMIAGTYKGIHFYRYEGGRFINQHVHAHFESARIVAIHDGAIWVAHPYKGIFKVQPDAAGRPVVQAYVNSKGLLSANNNYVYKVKNRIVAATENGIFEYHAAADSFQRSAFFHDIFGQNGIRYLKEDGAGNIWFIREKSLGVVDLSGAKPKIIYLSELNDKLVSGFEYIDPVDEHNVFVGAEKGFYHINFAQYKENQSALQVHIRAVSASGKGDSLLYGGYFGEVNEIRTQPGTAIPAIASHLNSFRFEFASTLYGQQSNIEYRYLLEGYDKGWSDWSRKTEKEYTYLPAGTYTFQVMGRNNLGNESAISSYTFTIRPPWYQTVWAYLLYAALLAAFAFGLHRWQKRKFVAQQARHEEEQKRLQYLHQLELERSEKEIVKLRNEKLEAEIEHKNTKLASSAMHLVQRGELLTKIKEEMVRLKKNMENGKGSDDFKKIIRIISEEDKMNEEWEQFAFHFDKVHSDFLMALKNRFPTLTSSELKLCAYLRMNLSSKEIAQLMNITVRGVEISRYRLRKKLQLTTETNLFTFLLGIQSAPMEVQRREP